MNIEMLKNANIDYDEGLKRFSGKAVLYEKYINKFLADPTFAQLQEAMNQRDNDMAFKCAHTLKGIAGNLSFNGFNVLVSSIVEDLRSKDFAKAELAFPCLEKEYMHLIDGIKEAL